jgi:hypothetical protein
MAVGTSVKAGSVGIKAGVSLRNCSKIDDRGFGSAFMAFTDKNQFGIGDPEDEFQTEAFPLESADSESLDEESSDMRKKIFRKRNWPRR